MQKSIFVIAMITAISLGHAQSSNQKALPELKGTATAQVAEPLAAGIEHELRKYELALVHRGFWRKTAKDPESDFRRSNRGQTQTLNLASESLTCGVLMFRRWDTIDSHCFTGHRSVAM